METKEMQTACTAPKSKKGLGMTLTEAIGELEKGYRICNQDEPKGLYYYLYCIDAEVVLLSNEKRKNYNDFKEQAKNDKSVWYIYQPEPLKNKTQQKRAELLEKQLLQLFEADKIILDLRKRNGNLTRITNDQTERIDVMQHELKNYESAIEVIETNYKESSGKLNKQAVDMTRNFESAMLQLKDCESRNNTLCDHFEAAKESRERLASKFTNWFIFLVFTNIGSIAWGVYQLLTK